MGSTREADPDEGWAWTGVSRGFREVRSGRASGCGCWDRRGWDRRGWDRRGWDRRSWDRRSWDRRSWDRHWGDECRLG
ncbi:MAG: hypothetical protein DRI90_26570 [Deltaproteobacteria bacterium]|nr:MAG: hypothetical protein DRI90_26570 [Deltaproteobacteria bacterium]